MSKHERCEETIVQYWSQKTKRDLKEAKQRSHKQVTNSK